MQKVVIVMPAYNEAENIGLMIHTLFDEIFPNIDGVNMHLLVVDDNSPDGTGNIVKKLQPNYPNLHILQEDRRGLGWAYVHGFRYATNKLQADAVMEMDADFQHPPKFVIPMIQAYMDGADYVIGSRYVQGGSVPKEWAPSRRAISYFGNLFIRLALVKPGIHDLTTGFRLTKVKGVLDQIDLEHLMKLDRFSHKVDLLYQSIKNAKKVVEVPLEFSARTKDRSKFNWQETVSTFQVAIILGIKDKIKLFKFGTVGLAGFVVNFLFLRLFRNLGFNETLAWIFSTEIAIINNYVFNNLWTFVDTKISGLKETIFKFLQFNLTSIGALIIQSILGPIGTKLVGVQYDGLVLAAIVLFVVLPYNFTMYNLVIWKKK
ncbi:MAG TPA: glycosyltransferase family 2 protein [Alphaproteobacteria bacterium]|jgi:dolichol-phosphate mannosyltransferase|nr:glycosyltransferase family 2 protein [Alphaproteobacteria bacterium]